MSVSESEPIQATGTGNKNLNAEYQISNQEIEIEGSYQFERDPELQDKIDALGHPYIVPRDEAYEIVWLTGHEDKEIPAKLLHGGASIEKDHAVEVMSTNPTTGKVETDMVLASELTEHAQEMHLDRQLLDWNEEANKPHSLDGLETVEHLQELVSPIDPEAMVAKKEELQAKREGTSRNLGGSAIQETRLT